jgi:hypothetical protein
MLAIYSILVIQGCQSTHFADLEVFFVMTTAMLFYVPY